jgi:hypothetical protein
MAETRKKRFTAYEVPGSIKPRIRDVFGVGGAVHFDAPMGSVNVPVPK